MSVKMKVPVLNNVRIQMGVSYVDAFPDIPWQATCLVAKVCALRSQEIIHVIYTFNTNIDNDALFICLLFVYKELFTQQ